MAKPIAFVCLLAIIAGEAAAIIWLIDYGMWTFFRDMFSPRSWVFG